MVDRILAVTVHHVVERLAHWSVTQNCSSLKRMTHKTVSVNGFR